MKRLLLALFFACLWASGAYAQIPGVRVVTTCGNPSPWPALNTQLGSPAFMSVDSTMTVCASGSGGGGGGSTPFLYGGTPMTALNLVGGTPQNNIAIPAGSTTLLITSSLASGNIVHCREDVSSSTPASGTDPSINPGQTVAYNVTGLGVLSCETGTGTQNVGLFAGSGSYQAAAGNPPNIGPVGSTIGFAATIQGSASGVAIPVTGTLAFVQFAPNGNYSTPLVVGASSARTTLPGGGGTVVAIYNVGASDAYIQLGSSSVVATVANDHIPAGGFLCFGVGSNADIAAIETAGATTLNVSGGTGGCAGAGAGGGGSGSGGAVTIADGADVAEGHVADGAWSSGDGTLVALGKATVNGIAEGVFTTSGHVLPAQAIAIGGQTATGADALQVEHCSYPKAYADIETTTGTGIQVVAGVSATKIYICELDIVNSTAANISLIEGSNSTCSATTGGVFLNPGVTAANGALLQAGITRGGSNSTVAGTATTGNTLCVLFTTTNSPQVNVHLAYVQQ